MANENLCITVWERQTNGKEVNHNQWEVDPEFDDLESFADKLVWAFEWGERGIIDTERPLKFQGVDYDGHKRTATWCYSEKSGDTWWDCCFTVQLTGPVYRKFPFIKTLKANNLLSRR